ncbi:hypothetical protein [Allopusillimonas ginsengisoli]|uniref:hypothetical protein n=1 Tax=Allopusillimonas ginsengisoli TaxID=453575 RepID=UPI0010208159|nr:hypothetical protein [Allopusillimonas ginsengisoli]TEA76922.1 hypothetical protein ERE07_17950 [Allopusillimonas ginsengisoli]
MVKTDNERLGEQSMGSLRFIARRIMGGVTLIIAVVVLNFFLLSAAPGDVADMLATQAGGATTEQIDNIRKEMGLDRTVFRQMLI